MKYFALTASALALFFSCQNTPQPAQPSVTPSQTSSSDGAHIPADFLEFYEKFHSDSLYQMAHIVWPLQGLTSEAIDSTHNRRKEVYWQKADWRMHRKIDLSSGDFKSERQMLGDFLIVERISYAAADYGLERRFAKSGAGGEWELIYYADMQETR